MRVQVIFLANANDRQPTVTLIVSCQIRNIKKKEEEERNKTYSNRKRKRNRKVQICDVTFFFFDTTTGIVFDMFSTDVCDHFR